jgi:Prenyltransferase and squalene oxidase repeat
VRLLLSSAGAILLCSVGLSAQLKKEATAVDKGDPNAAAIAKGVDYLKVEVPKWKAEHPCYSCHNNGDATRALLVAGSKGYDIGTSLDDTLAFLKQPAQWDQNKAPSGFDDKTLAKIQFAGALAVAERHGKAASTEVEAAAKLLLAEQQADGSWQLDNSQSLGSPATYGTLIATWSARTTLISSGMQPDNFTIVQTDKWIRGLTVENVLDASATVLALDLASDVMAENLRRNCLSIIRTGQSKEGGWGPYVTAAPQVFDTALAVLALSSLEAEPRLARSTYRPEELKEAIANGKKYLVSQQRPDGSWPETTRPANQESYAQRISTTGWAMLALLTGA